MRGQARVELELGFVGGPGEEGGKIQLFSDVMWRGSSENLPPNFQLNGTKERNILRSNSLRREKEKLGPTPVYKPQVGIVLAISSSVRFFYLNIIR
jgi:hypothetical protein